MEKVKKERFETKYMPVGILRYDVLKIKIEIKI
jgi:hypothetical protein